MRHVIYIKKKRTRSVGGGGGEVVPDFFVCSLFSCSADHGRDWPPCKVVFFALAITTLNVRNDNVGNHYTECEKRQVLIFLLTTLHHLYVCIPR